VIFLGRYCSEGVFLDKYKLISIWTQIVKQHCSTEERLSTREDNSFSGYFLFFYMRTVLLPMEGMHPRQRDNGSFVEGLSRIFATYVTGEKECSSFPLTKRSIEEWENF